MSFAGEDMSCMPALETALVLDEGIQKFVFGCPRTRACGNLLVGLAAYRIPLAGRIEACPNSLSLLLSHFRRGACDVIRLLLKFDQLIIQVVLQASAGLFMGSKACG